MAKKRSTKKKTTKSSKATKKVAKKTKPKATPGVKKKTKRKASTSKKTVKKKKPAASSSSRKSTSRKSGSVDKQIKSIDQDIIKLASKRADLTVKQIESQADPRAALFDSEIETELWQRLEEADSGVLPKAAVRSIFREIVSAARAQVKQLRVAYLGPPFSFTHLAAIQKFGKSSDLVPVNTIAAVFEEVNRGHASYGLVPIENSTDGRIVDTLDMFTRLPLRICGEVQMRVHHNLLSRSPRSEITEVYSKPQALSQCRDWLARNMPQARLVDVTSTSTAAQLARNKPGAAAVASQQAAVQYDLLVVAERIEDNTDNITRFAVIGDEQTKSTGSDRTALLLQIPHSPGALSDALLVFKNNKINLTWIESFPLRGAEVGYLFFLDFEGHNKDAKVKRTLADLEKKAVRLEVLGSYPRSDPQD